MSQQDLKVLVIKKKQQPVNKNPQVDTDGKKVFSGKNSQGPDFNAASVERKIDSGELGAPPTISKELSQRIIDTRREKEIKTQKELATKASVPVNEITLMENGKYILTPASKKNLLKVARVLGLGKVF